MDMLGAEMPIIQPAIRRVLYWGSADQPLDFTAKNDVAAFTAAAALDKATPRILRIAGDTVSVRDIARTMSEISGERYRTSWAGTIGSLGLLIRLTKILAPQPRATFPAWQGMQYMGTCSAGAASSTRSTTTATPTCAGPQSASNSSLHQHPNHGRQRDEAPFRESG